MTISSLNPASAASAPFPALGPKYNGEKIKQSFCGIIPHPFLKNNKFSRQRHIFRQICLPKNAPPAAGGTIPRKSPFANRILCGRIDKKQEGDRHMEFWTHSPEQTEQVGADLAARLRPDKSSPFGEPLGAGKTTFTRGLARGLGIPGPGDQPDLSPSSTNTPAGQSPCSTLICTG